MEEERKRQQMTSLIIVTIVLMIIIMRVMFKVLEYKCRLLNIKEPIVALLTFFEIVNKNEFR